MPMQVRDTRSARSRRSGPSYARRGEAAELAEWRRAAWNMFWLLVIGKVLIMIALAIVALHALHPADRGWRVVLLLNWSWILLAVLLVIGPTAYWWRMRRARRKRKALIYAEWHVD
jgi:hypothetical protein